MFFVTATTTVTREARDEVIAAFLQWSETARTLPGVITHGFYADLSDENTVRLYAEYESEEAWKESTKHPGNSIMSDAMKAHGLTAKGGRYSATSLTDNS